MFCLVGCIYGFAVREDVNRMIEEVDSSKGTDEMFEIDRENVAVNTVMGLQTDPTKVICKLLLKTKIIFC